MRWNEHLQKLMEAKEKRITEDNSYMFKRFASHNPLISNAMMGEK